MPREDRHPFLMSGLLEGWDWFDNGEGDLETKAKQAQLYYAESWALVYFLLHGEDGRYKKTLHEYFRYELEGEGNSDNFERALRNTVGVDLNEFQAAFVDYIRSLE